MYLFKHRAMSSALVRLACLVALAGGSSTAHAIANPTAINWGTPSAAAFVTSLYIGVLGRAPESAAVVAGWAASVTGSMQSRLNVFNGFINSAEYRGKYGSVTGPYAVWANNCPRSPANRYVVAVQPPRGSWSAQRNNVARTYGVALARYYQAAFPYRPC